MVLLNHIALSQTRGPSEEQPRWHAHAAGAAPITQKNKTKQDLGYKASSRIFVKTQWHESIDKGVI